MFLKIIFVLHYNPSVLIQYFLWLGSRSARTFVSTGSDSLPKYIQPPVIPGHEFVGEVTKLGPGESLDKGAKEECFKKGGWGGTTAFSSETNH